MVLRQGAPPRRQRAGTGRPCGLPLWVSGALPGSTHDLTAARELVLPQTRPYLNILPFLADSSFEGAGAGVLVPVRKPARGELDIDTKPVTRCSGPCATRANAASR